MTNADKFKEIFGLYATELWVMPEADFLRWLSANCKTESQIDYKRPYEDCEDCETHLKAQYGDCNKCKWYGDKQVCGRCRSRNLYAPKDEPQTNKDFEVTYTCSFTDCDNFKNPDYARCVECKRKQSEAKYKPELQTERNK